MTATTTVASILSETTRPSRTLRPLTAPLASARSLLGHHSSSSDPRWRRRRRRAAVIERPVVDARRRPRCPLVLGESSGLDVLGLGLLRRLARLARTRRRGGAAPGVEAATGRPASSPPSATAISRSRSTVSIRATSLRASVRRGEVVQLPGGQLEPEVEQLAAVLRQPALELVVVELAQLGGVGHGHQTSTSAVPWVPGRTTKRALNGSFWMARSMAVAGQVAVHAGQLEEDPAGPDDGHPVLGVALARAHAGLGRLLGHRLVGEDPDPHLAATLHVAGHGDTGGLDLALGQPAPARGPGCRSRRR